MKRFRTVATRLIASLAFLVIVACGISDRDAETPEPQTVALGELVDVVLANGGVAIGVAIQVTRADGTTQRGYFAGPRPLADAVSEGTWTFRADALHARVRLLGEGETLRPREG